MKKSDKLLLLLVLLAFALFGSAHLNLYWKYKKGIAVATNDAIDLVRKKLPTPAFLSIKGFSNVTLIPSDSFAIEWKKPDLQPPSPGRPKEYLAEKNA
ncbi:MAG TPA: hypothetical protein VHC48_06290, partial [Puia sp.]|nr:hypothetical protein [Puia sp.]